MLWVVRTIGIVLVSCVALLAACEITIYLLRGPACFTELRKEIIDLAGFDFEIKDTYCSTIAHTATMSVYGAKKGERRQTLLFKYDPIYSVDLPTINISERDRLVISVPQVSSLFERRYRWQGMQIEYRIGQVTHPGEGRWLDEE
jgi:hypothetical protein